MTDIKKKARKRASILSEDQKKKHHIESEHKRRQAIRDAFDKLVDVVPGLVPADSRSEALILTKSADYLTVLFKQHEELIQKIENQNIQIDKNLKLTIPSRIYE